MAFPARSRPAARIVAVITSAVFLSAVAPVGPFGGKARAGAIDDLLEAKMQFEFAQYDRALDTVEKLLAERRDELGKDSLREAYVLQGRCLGELGRRTEAEQAFCRAARTDPAWRPDPFVFKTEEIELYDRAVETCAALGAPSPTAPPEPPAPPAPSPLPPPAAPAPSGGGMPGWVKYAGGGAALVLGIVLLSGGGGDGGTARAGRLPGFPLPPD